MTAPADNRFPKRRRRAAALFLLLGLMIQPAHGQNEPEDPVGLLRDEINALKADYESRIAALEARLAEFETGAAEAPASTAAKESQADELASLREAARRAAAEPSTGVARPDPQPPSEPAVGKERNLSLLNPEISFTGIMLGVSVSNGREEFAFEEFELDLQSALDPFSRTRVTLAVGDEGLELEEAYINYSSLSGGLNLFAGKFRQRFGPLNRQHLHALPQSDYPLVYQTLFGEEGLSQTGVSLNWLLPRPWATANEVTLEITDGENEEAFAGEEFEDFAFLGRIKNFWELSDASYLEWGLSAITGDDAQGDTSRVYGTDLTCSWQPAGRAKYRGLTWRIELLRSERDDALGVRQKALGGYTYFEGLLRRNLYGGVRFDRAENPLDPGSHTTGWVPFLTWWQSEFVRLRAEYGLFESRPSGASANRFTFQLTWAAGPHKHESY